MTGICSTFSDNTSVTTNTSQTVDITTVMQQNANTVLYDDNKRPYILGRAPGERIYQDAYNVH